MIPYGDTNFFTRIYLELPESNDADRLVKDASRSEAVPLPLTWLHRMEIPNAFQLHVFQGKETGQSFISSRQAALAYENFQEDVRKSEFLRPVLLPTTELEKQFIELSLRHTARHGFRAYDLIHVASALLLDCDTFWSFDAKANSLAKLQGFKIR